MFLFSGSPSRKKKMTHGAMDFNELVKLVRAGLMVRTDSRQMQQGECFVAMPGTAVRGIDYIPMALQKGAKYIVAPKDARDLVAPVAEDEAVVCYVENTAKALGELARAYFKTDELDMKLVAVTGTNGKTTTSYIIEHLLAAAGRKVGVLGTVTYRWPGFSIDAKLTTPDCWMIHELLANMAKADVDAAIMETSSHALDQYRVAGLDFDVAVISNLTQDHLDYHGDMETYFNAKAKLFTEYPHQDKCCVINFDDPYCRRLLNKCENAIGYGFGDPVSSDKHTLRGRVLSCDRHGLKLECGFKGKTWEIDSGLMGQHNAMNLLAAQAVGLCIGLNCKDMRKLNEFKGVPGRLERVENEQGLHVFVDYAHTPDALINVQKALRSLDFDRLITVFGCGGDRDRTKRPIMGRAVAEYADVAVLTSDNPRSEDPVAIMDDARPGLKGAAMVMEDPDRQEAITMAVREMTPNDVLLIAGKGHEDYQVLKDVTLHFSDAEAVQQAIATIKGEQDK